MVDLMYAFGKILNIWEESKKVNYLYYSYSYIHVQKVLFLQMCKWVFLKDAEQNS